MKNKIIIMAAIAGIMAFMNIKLFSYDFTTYRNLDNVSRVDNSETYYEEEEVVEESVEQVDGVGEVAKKYICKYVWKVVCAFVCMGPDHQTYVDCHQECTRTLVNKSCKPYV